jgi:DNA-binding CsgD family transcriptional regulator
VTKGADAATWRAEWSRLGDSDPGVWEVAAQAWTDLGRPHRAGYARWRQAEALLASLGGRAAAGPVLRLAAESARTHVPLSRAIADLAHRARIGLVEPLVKPTAPQPVSTRFGLTERELAVLALIGQGRTNAEIGAALFISRKTASVHVTNILRKLGVGSRVQAAAVAARAELTRASEADDS